MDKKKFTNRLIFEKSPYLLQHAHNPVDWYPWGEEAFQAAKEKNKPIFLSIGYSTCHWCHVMEKESFEDPRVAQTLNQTFINIKVDREELPGVDSLYMEFAQSMIAGASGWPLNVILTPELHPFFAITYLPPYQAHGLMGLVDLAQRINETWNDEEERDKLETQSEYILELFSRAVHIKGDELTSKEELIDATEILFKMTDSTYGGMKGAPKFPLAYYIGFLLHYSAVFSDSRGSFIVDRTLEMMHRGGIYDHLGGGFSRYSVDEKWFAPHFEKMLYDNALLLKAYFEGWQVSKKESFAQVVREVAHYLIRDMKAPEGGFYAAEDADSEGHEGYFYTWPYNEIHQILGPEADTFCKLYGVIKGGNFEGRNILHLTSAIEEFAEAHNQNFEDFACQLDKNKQKLWTEREKRVHPAKDTKVITAWNGLIIDALASSAILSDHLEYLHIALECAMFVKNNLWINKRLKRRWCDGEAAFEAGLEDYAFMIKGALSLFETSGDSQWLAWALELCVVADELFKSQAGAYYQTSEEETSIVLRKSQFSDGAEPSGNSIQCENLLRLFDFTHDSKYLTAAEDILNAAGKYISQYPAGYIYHLQNLTRYYYPNRQTLVIALNKEMENKKEIFNLLSSNFLPFRTIIWKRETDQELAKMLPWLEEQKPFNNHTTLYICQQNQCQSPLINLEEIEKALTKA